MTSIEWGISISNQRWGEKESEWGGERGRGRQKEGHSLASDESERGGNILKGSRASKSERKAEWRRQRRKEELRKETMWIYAFYENLTEAHGHTCWHIFNVHKVAVYALSSIVFLFFPLPVVRSHFLPQLQTSRVPWPVDFLQRICPRGYTIPKAGDLALGHSEQTYSKVLLRIRSFRTNTCTHANTPREKKTPLSCYTHAIILGVTRRETEVYLWNNLTKINLFRLVPVYSPNMKKTKHKHNERDLEFLYCSWRAFSTPDTGKKTRSTGCTTPKQLPNITAKLSIHALPTANAHSAFAQKKHNSIQIKYV